MKQVLDEQDAVMANQAQEIEERQNEIESLCTELQTWQEKCSFAEKELDRRKTEISSLKEQTMTASEENKRLEKLSEEIEKMKVRVSSYTYVRLRLVLFIRLFLECIIQNMVRHFVTHKQVQADKRHPI